MSECKKEEVNHELENLDGVDCIIASSSVEPHHRLLYIVTGKARIYLYSTVSMVADYNVQSSNGESRNSRICEFVMLDYLLSLSDC
jgi:hypothetical protein